MIAEREFEKLDMIASYKDKVEPCRWTCYLISGGLMAVVSIIFMIHIFLYAVLKVENKNVQPFLNGVLESLETSRASFFATLFIVLFCFYLMFAAVRGNVKFGLRFFFISFYPIVPKETFISSFFANCLIMNVWMFAMMQLCTQLFRGYIRGTDAAKIYLVHVRHMDGMGWVWEKNFFIVWAAVWWFVSFIYFCLKPQEKIQTLEGINKSDLSDKGQNQA
jgi:LMBR1 domain-containing protein 1